MAVSIKAAVHPFIHPDGNVISFTTTKKRPDDGAG